MKSKTKTNASTLEGKRYVACRRVSRIAGRSGASFMSPEMQAESMERFAAMHGIDIIEWVDENDGGTRDASGGTVEREGLMHALAQCEHGNADGILVAKVDRFARTVTGGLAVINKLEDIERDLVAAAEGVIVGDEKATATDKMVRTLWLTLAQWQRDMLTEQWEATRERHIDAGVHNVEPYGYRKGADRKLKPVAEEKPFVLMAFELRAAGEGWQRITEKLNAAGAPMRERKLKGKTVKAPGFTHARIASIIENRTYLGEVRSGEFVNTNAHEAIVPLDLFERANAAKGVHKSGKAETYALTGLVRCASCGVRMRGATQTSTSNGKRIRYYSCRRYHSFGTCPAPASLNADVLEALVIERFEREYLTDGINMVGTDATDGIDVAKRQLDAAEAEVRDFLTSASARALKSVSVELWEEGLAERTDAVSAAQKALTDARNDAHGITLPEHLTTDTIRELPLTELRGFLAEGIELVAVAHQPKTGTRLPLAERVAIFTGNETGMPDLSGGHVLRPIVIAQ